MRYPGDERIPRVLTVAGSDSGGGAGIQADLKTMALLGAYGMSAVTALTAQNTRGVKAIHEVPAEFVGLQMEAVIRDIGVDALKTGMLVNSAIIREVARRIRRHRLDRVVVDPVMIAKGGARLLSPEAAAALAGELMPLCLVVTPNLPETEVLTGVKIHDVSGMREGARRLHRMGAKNVLVKGGHLAGKPLDLLFDGRRFHEFSGERLATRHTHGTGCTLSAAIAVELARGALLPQAVERAKALVAGAIRDALPLGKGCGPVNPYRAALERSGF